MAQSTHQRKKSQPANISRERYSASIEENNETEKALATILAHLHELQSKRPSILASDKKEKTRRTVENILASGREIFIRDGHAALSLRNVADHAGVAVGNLTYHFPTKNALLKAVMREALADYIELHLEQFDKNRDSPLEILLNLVEFYVRSGRRATRFFYQFWGYAGSSEDARTFVRELYQPLGRFVYYLVRAANPKLTDQDIRRVTLQIFSLEEGYKIFIGMGPQGSSAIETAEQDIRELTRRLVMDT